MTGHHPDDRPKPPAAPKVPFDQLIASGTDCAALPEPTIEELGRRIFERKQ